MDFFEKRFKFNESNMSELERLVWNYIKDSKDTVIYQSIEEVSKNLHVSTATISRAIKRLGFAGFSELKFVLRRHYQDGTSERIDFDDLDSQMYKGILVEEIRETFESLSDRDVLRAVTMIKEAPRIEIFAVGGSFGTGLDFSKKLFGLGKVVNARYDWDDLRIAARLLGNTGIAIIISMSGETEQLIEYAETLRENGSKILSIVGSKDSTIESLSNITLRAKSYFYSFASADLSSRIGMVSVLDYLLSRYVTN